MDTNWPPDYTIRKSKKAHHISFRISAKKGLEIVMPHQSTPISMINELLDDKRSWIEKNLQQIQQEQAKQALEKPLPDQIPLRSIDEIWHISLIESNNRPAIILRPHQELALYGEISDVECCKTLLVNWIRRKANRHLSAQLKQISDETKLTYNKLSLRGQITRWGSCSAEKNISLNYKLLFLPQTLSKHVLIHELCHTKHLDHSARFWQLVAEYDPHWESNRRALRDANRYIPTWLE